MKAHKLAAETRTILGRKVKQLRAKSILPATLYGKGVGSQSIQIPLKEFLRTYDEVGETGLIDLTVGAGKSVPVLIHNLQYHPVTRTLLHTDFLQVNLKEKLQTSVPLTVVGESSAVKDQTATLLTLMSEIEVEALPTDIPEEIQVDISGLKEVDQTIKVSQLIAPKGSVIISDPDQDVVRLSEIVQEEEAPPAPAEGESSSEGEKEESTPSEDKQEEAG